MKKSNDETDVCTQDNREENEVRLSARKAYVFSQTVKCRCCSAVFPFGEWFTDFRCSQCFATSWPRLFGRQSPKRMADDDWPDWG